MATDETSEQHQRPETAEQTRHREEAAFQADIRECGLENARRLRALKSDDFLWAFIVETAQIMREAGFVGGNGTGESTGTPLSTRQARACDRVLLCRRVHRDMKRMLELDMEEKNWLLIEKPGHLEKEDGGA